MYDVGFNRENTGDPAGVNKQNTGYKIQRGCVTRHKWVIVCVTLALGFTFASSGFAIQDDTAGAGTAITHQEDVHPPDAHAEGGHTDPFSFIIN